MDTRLPHAIRKERDLLALVGLHFLSPYLAFLLLVRWTSYFCPHCSQVFRRDYWPDNVRLGAGDRTCRGCAKVFDDGSREWLELEMRRKFRFFLPPGIIAIAVSVLGCAIAALFIAPRDVVNLPAGIIVIGVSLFPTIVWCLIRLLAVRHSIHRYQNEPASMRRRLETGTIG
jgi:hypothetical protein